MAEQEMTLIEQLQNPPRIEGGHLDEDKTIDLMRTAAAAAEKDDLVKFVNLSGPGVDAIDARKETNNHHKVTTKELRDSFEKIKKYLFSGLAALI